MKGSRDERYADALMDQRKDDRAEEERTRRRIMFLGERVLEILTMTELHTGFDWPDKIGAIRTAAESLGLLPQSAGSIRLAGRGLERREAGSIPADLSAGGDAGGNSGETKARAGSGAHGAEESAIDRAIEPRPGTLPGQAEPRGQPSSHVHVSSGEPEVGFQAPASGVAVVDWAERLARHATGKAMWNDASLAAVLRASLGSAIDALAMVAEQECGLATWENGYHCGECAWCIARKEMEKLNAK